jgi:hypothetical protein
MRNAARRRIRRRRRFIPVAGMGKRSRRGSEQAECGGEDEATDLGRGLLHGSTPIAWL